jgi:methylated-DNA-[protein]-cysteine S-methyltransferase
MASEALDYFRPPAADELGLLRIRAQGAAIIAIEFVVRQDRPARPDGTTAEACRQLAEYFEGTRRLFELPLSPGGTDFQRGVWSALCAIPWGQTRSYGEIASQLGRPGAQRAVGAANRRNPIAVVIPCHRVIGRDGSLTGYAAGVARKQWLLALEQASTCAHGLSASFMGRV